MSRIEPDPDRLTVEYPPTAVAQETRTSESTSTPEAPATRSSQLPAQVGKYRVVECLGGGGQGQVFRAVHPSLGRDVVIKWAVRSLPASLQQRLIEEGRVLARLDDPGVVRVHDVDVHDGRPFLVFEHVAGQSLAALLKHRRFSAREAVALTARLAAIVDRLHRRGVLHRDLKPGNILIDAAGQPRLLDFGLASMTELWQDGPAPPDGVVGTLAYMAPEQAKGQDAGPAGDVFGLGAVLYELLTGRPPHQASTRSALWEQALAGRVTPPRALVPHIPRRVEAICLKALAPESGERFASAGQLGQALRRYLQRRWLLAVGAVHVALFAIALAVVILRPFDRPASPPLAGPPPQDPAPPELLQPPDPPPSRPAPPKPPAGWKAYRSEPGRFGVWLPGIPQENTSAVPTESGQREMRQATLNDTQSGLYYSIVYADFPGIKFEQTQQRLDAARDGAVRNVKGKIVKEQPIELGQHPGREVIVEIARASRTLRLVGASTVGLMGTPLGQGPVLAACGLDPERTANPRIRFRMYLVEQRMYQLLVGGHGENVNGKDAELFLKSFQLLADKP